MNTLWIIAALVIGIALGVFYFGGLWLTVRSVTKVQRPAMLVFGSFLGRMGIVLLGFYLVMNGRWERMVAVMAGFLLARMLLMRRLRLDTCDTTPSAYSTGAKKATE